MKKLFLFFYFFTLTAIIWSQDFTKEYYFKKNSSKLTETQIQEISSLITSFEEPKFLKLQVSGYSDNSGTRQTNMRISEERALEVQKIAINKGVPQENISLNYYGVLRPKYTNLDKSGRAKNRRVVIIGKYTPIIEEQSVVENKGNEEVEVKDEFIEDEKPQTLVNKTVKQNYDFPLNSSKSIVAQNGTKVSIEPDAFNIPADLREANPNDNVQLEIVEYYDKSDFVLNDLSTQLTDGTIIESGGMVDVRASYAGEPVDLRPNRTIALEFPTDNYKAGMRDWYGTEDKDGNIVWNEQPYDLDGKEKKDPEKKKKFKKILLITLGVLAVAATTYAIASSTSGSGNNGSSSNNNAISNPGFNNSSSNSSGSSSGNDSPYRNTNSENTGSTSNNTNSNSSSTNSEASSLNSTGNSNQNQDTDQSRFQIFSRGTGRVNCDRLINPSVTTSFRLTNPNPNATIKMVFKDRNIVLIGNQHKNGKVTFRGLPLNEEVYIIATDKKGAMCDFAMCESNTSNWRLNKSLEFETIESTQLKNRLSCLDN